MLSWGDGAYQRGCRRHPSKSFPKRDKNPLSSGKRAVSEILTCPRSPPCRVTRREKSLKERLISGGDKHLSWRKGREEKTFLDVSRKQKQFVSKKRYSLFGSDAGPELFSGELFKVLLTNKSEAGLPIRRVLYQSPRRPMSEKIERNLLPLCPLVFFGYLLLIIVPRLFPFRHVACRNVARAID